MLSFLKPSRKAIVGIGIKNEEVSLLQLKRNRHEINVVNFGLIKLPKETIIKGKINDLEAVIRALNYLGSSTKTLGKDAAIALPLDAVMIKVIQPISLAQQLDENELKKISHHFPNSAEMCFDVLKLNENQMLLVAGKKNQLNEYINAVNASGFNVVVVEVDFFAAIRALSVTNSSSFPYAILDVQPDYIQFMMMTSTLGELHCSAVVNEETKLIELIREIKSVLQRFGLNQLSLTGNTILFPNVIALLEKNSDIQANCINPFLNMTIGKMVNAKKLFQEASSLITTCGLALRKSYDRY